MIIVVLMLAVAMGACSTLEPNIVTCQRICPEGELLYSDNMESIVGSKTGKTGNKTGPQVLNEIYADCCLDKHGEGWSSCAWNFRVLADQLRTRHEKKI
jgi:hypothetical protein